MRSSSIELAVIATIIGCLIGACLRNNPDYSVRQKRQYRKAGHTRHSQGYSAYLRRSFQRHADDNPGDIHLLRPALLLERINFNLDKCSQGEKLLLVGGEILLLNTL